MSLLHEICQTAYILGLLTRRNSNILSHIFDIDFISINKVTSYYHQFKSSFQNQVLQNTS